MAQQTAVEWLAEKMEKLIPPGNQIEIFVMLDKAKQMEKVNNEYSWIAGAEYSISVLKDKTAKGSKESFEEYYKETYKQ